MILWGRLCIGTLISVYVLGVAVTGLLSVYFSLSRDQTLPANIPSRIAGILLASFGWPVFLTGVLFDIKKQL